MKLGAELLSNMCEALSLIFGAGKKQYYLKSKKATGSGLINPVNR